MCIMITIMMVLMLAMMMIKMTKITALNPKPSNPKPETPIRVRLCRGTLGPKSEAAICIVRRALECSLFGAKREGGGRGRGFRV